MTAAQAETIQELTRASHSALGGTDWRDPFCAYGIDPDAAAAFTVGWVDELAEKTEEMGEDRDGRAFAYRIALGMLAVGIDYGKRQR